MKYYKILMGIIEFRVR